MDKRITPRYENRGKIGILAADKQLLSEGSSLNISVKGVRFEANTDLIPEQNYYIVFGYVRYSKLEILTQIVAKDTKGGIHYYSARFVDEDLMQKSRIRNYVEKVRAGDFQ